MTGVLPGPIEDPPASWRTKVFFSLPFMLIGFGVYVCNPKVDPKRVDLLRGLSECSAGLPLQRCLAKLKDVGALKEPSLYQDNERIKLIDLTTEEDGDTKGRIEVDIRVSMFRSKRFIKEYSAGVNGPHFK